MKCKTKKILLGGISDTSASVLVFRIQISNWYVLILNVRVLTSLGMKLTMQRGMRRLHLCLGEGFADIWSLILGKRELQFSLLHDHHSFNFQKGLPLPLADSDQLCRHVQSLLCDWAKCFLGVGQPFPKGENQKGVYFSRVRIKGVYFQKNIHPSHRQN